MGGQCGGLRAGGALPKANQSITTDLLPSSDPLNIDHLLSKHPGTDHPTLITVLQTYWDSDAGAEFLNKWFSIPKISLYFRTRSSVSRYRRLSCVRPHYPTLFKDNLELHDLIITWCHFLILEVTELLGYPDERGCLLLVNYWCVCFIATQT